MNDRNQYKLPLRNIAYMLYHMAKRDMYDPDFIRKMENESLINSSNKVEARHCFGALYGYYRLNQGNISCIRMWEDRMTE